MGLMPVSFITAFAWPVTILGLTAIAFSLWRSWANELELRIKLQSFVRFREMLLDSMNEGFVVYDKLGRTQMISDSYTRITGWTLDEIKGTNAFQRTLPGETPSLEELQSRLFSHPHEILAMRYRIRHKDGRMIPVRSQLRYVPEGVPGFPEPCVVAISRDISVETQAEEKLQNTEALYESLVDNLNEALMLVDLQMKVLFVSNAMQRISGYSPDEMLGQPPERRVAPEDIWKVRDGFRDVLKVGKSEAIEFEMLCKDGRRLPVRASARYLPKGVPGLPQSCVLVTYEDISEARQAKAHLERSEQFYQSLVENLHEAILVTNMQRQAVYASPVIEKLLGYRPEEMLGLPPSKRVPEKDLSKLQGAFEQAVSDGLPLYIEHHLLHKDGHEVPVRSLACYIPHGMPGYPEPCLMITYADMSETREAGRKLEQSNRFYETLVNNLNEVVQVMDLQYKTRYISPVMQRLLGYPPEEVVGLTPGDRIYPEDRPMLPIYFQRIIEARGEVVMAHYRLIHKNGALIHVEASCRLLPEGIPGVPEPCVLISYFDVTKRKEAESKLESSERFYRALLENSLDGVSVISPENKVLYHSPSVRRITGMDPDDRQGGSIFDNFPPQELPRIRGLLKELITHPGKVVEAEVQSKNIKGEIRVFETVAQYHTDALGFPGIVVNFRDATDRKQTQEQLLKFERLATVGELTAGLAHELRNPLLAMSLTSEMLLQDKNLSPEQRQDISVILEQCRRMKGLLEDALGAASERPRPAQRLHVKSVFDQAANLAQRQLEGGSNKVTIRVDLDPEQLEILGEAGPLQQVMLNLLLNAIQAMPRGGQLVLEGRIDGEEGRLSVLDDGEGLPDRDLERIFEPFFTTKPNGSGLGLAICRRLLKAQGGRIGAERRERGTAMRIWLPLATVQSLKGSPR